MKDLKHEWCNEHHWCWLIQRKEFKEDSVNLSCSHCHHYLAAYSKPFYFLYTRSIILFTLKNFRVLELTCLKQNSTINIYYKYLGFMKLLHSHLYQYFQTNHLDHWTKGYTWHLEPAPWPVCFSHSRERVIALSQR